MEYLTIACKIKHTYSSFIQKTIIEGFRKCLATVTVEDVPRGKKAETTDRHQDEKKEELKDNDGVT